MCCSFIINQLCFILGFHVTSCHHKIPLNSRCHFFDSRNRYSSVTLVKLPIFGFSSHNFGEVAEFQYFQILEILYGWPWWPPYTKISLILGLLKFLNYSYFAKITRKPKIGNFTNMTKLCPFLESKKWHLLSKILWSRDTAPVVGLQLQFSDSCAYDAPQIC